MASNIIEFFGYSPEDASSAAKSARKGRQCPFLEKQCTKTLNDGEISGVCTLKPKTSGPVICCPIRLYANDYRILRDVAAAAFGKSVQLAIGSSASLRENRVVVFGKGWGKELRLPNRGKGGGYFVDWILAHIDESGDLVSFVAVEVQSIDTTGNYRAERQNYLDEMPAASGSTAGLNWENVNKRILPQLIYKGHVLRQEPLCQKGLFFVCPTPVHDKITERLGGALRPYPVQPGALTIMPYDLGPPVKSGEIRSLVAGTKITTTIDQVALAFTSPSNLPPPQVYENAIRSELQGL